MLDIYLNTKLHWSLYVCLYGSGSQTFSFADPFDDFCCFCFSISAKKKKAYNDKCKNNIISPYSSCIDLYLTGTVHVSMHVLTYVQIGFSRSPGNFLFS